MSIARQRTNSKSTQKLTCCIRVMNPVLQPLFFFLIDD